jgi:hypothetical protein
MHEAMAVGTKALQVLQPGHVIRRHFAHLNSRVVHLNASFTVFRAECLDRIGAAPLAEQAAVPPDEVRLLRSSRRRPALSAYMLLQNLGTLGIDLGRCRLPIAVGLCHRRPRLTLWNDEIACLP